MEESGRRRSRAVTSNRSLRAVVGYWNPALFEGCVITFSVAPTPVLTVHLGRSGRRTEPIFRALGEQPHAARSTVSENADDQLASVATQLIWHNSLRPKVSDIEQRME